MEDAACVTQSQKVLWCVVEEVRIVYRRRMRLSASFIMPILRGRLDVDVDDGMLVGVRDRCDYDR